MNKPISGKPLFWESSHGGVTRSLGHLDTGSATTQSAGLLAGSVRSCRSPCWHSASQHLANFAVEAFQHGGLSTSMVKVGDEWPKSALTTLIRSPFSIATVAYVWRQSWRQVRHRPDDWASRLN